MSTKLQSSRTAVKTFELEPDENFNPPIPRLPDAVLDPGTDAVTQVNNPGWTVPTWHHIRAHLPEARLARHAKCQTMGAHIQRTSTATGWSDDAVYPISCGDIGACPKCGFRYHTGKAHEHAQKLDAVMEAAQAGVAFARLVIDLPEWAHALKAQGCSKADTLGRLCPTDRRCRTCNEARKSYNAAAASELQLVKFIQDSLQQAGKSPVGFLRVTNVELGLTGPRLVVTLVAPEVSVFLTKDTASRTHWAGIDFDAFKAHVTAHIATLGATLAAFEVSRQAFHGDAQKRFAVLHDRFRNHVHTAPLALAHNAVDARVAVGDPGLDPALARTLTQAACLTATTTTGKERRVQRVAWCGFLAPTKLTRALDAIHVLRRIPETAPATIQILDVYKITAVDSMLAHVQSVRSGARTSMPRSKFRFGEFVDAQGRPVDSELHEDKWAFDAERKEREEREVERQTKLWKAELGNRALEHYAQNGSDYAARRSSLNMKRDSNPEVV